MTDFRGIVRTVFTIGRMTYQVSSFLLDADDMTGGRIGHLFRPPRARTTAFPPGESAPWRNRPSTTFPPRVAAPGARPAPRGTRHGRPLSRPGKPYRTGRP